MKTIKVVAAVIRDGNKVFATARGYGEFKGQWEFPGGKIEEGETPQQALVREIKEELEADQLKYPLKRYGTPEDIANLAIYLLSDASCWMTGSCVEITGGVN